MPNVLNIYKSGIPEGSVYIGRKSKFANSSKFHNPFSIGKDGNREQVIEKYEKYLMENPTLIELAKIELEGKDLVCFCAPQACHGEILLKLANSEHIEESKESNIFYET